MVKMYFLNPYNMYMQGKISKSVFRCIVDKYGLPMLFEVVEKLEYLNNADYAEREKFYRIMLLAGDLYEKQRKATARYKSPHYIKRISQQDTKVCRLLQTLLKFCRENKI